MKQPILAGGGSLLFIGLAIALLMASPVATGDDGPRFGPWSQAVAVGAPLRTPGVYEGCPFPSKDGLSLFFRKEALVAGTRWRFDIWVSQRDSADDPWGTPVNLGPLVNDPARQEGRPSLSWDGTTLYFWTDREWFKTASGGYWDMHVYQTTRATMTGRT